jgi:chromosome partitioning protein
MGTVLAVANQKGGVGKTTTAVNLGASIADAGYPTLLADLDPQCNATVALGLPKDSSPNVYDCLSDDLTLTGAAIPSAVERLDVVPSTPELAGANVELPRIAGS